MPGSLVIALAWRNLVRNLRRTLMLGLAVAVGVASLLVTAALLRGWLASTVDETLDALLGHLRVHDPAWLDDPGADANFPLDPHWREMLASNAAVAAWAARIRTPAAVMSERESRGAMLVGIDPASEAGLSFIADASVEGRVLEGPTDRGLLVGAALADALETRLGKRLVLMVQGADGRTVERGYRIVGVYDAPGDGLEQGYLFTGRAALAESLGLPIDAVTELSIRFADDAEDLDAWRSRLAPLDDAVEIYSWRELMPQAAALVEVSSSSIWVWYLILMSALGFGLVNTLLTSVMERVRELGLLQVVGMRPSGVLWQVLLESWFVLAVGLLAGLVLGGLALLLLADGVDLGAWGAAMEGFGLGRTLVPELALSDVVEISALVLALGVLGSIYPATKALAIDPLAALNRRGT